MKHKIIQSLIVVTFIWILICTFAHKIFNYMPMNKRNIVHLNGFVGCICNSSETGFGNQMKESEASERKKTQTSLFFHLLFLCTMLIVASCDSRKQYDFQSSNDALEEYHNFFLSIKGNTGCNAEQMATFINGWHEVADTVSCFIKKDPSFTAHCGLSARYDEISDSIRTELLRLTSNYTLSDVAYVKLHTSVYKENQELDSLKESATKFFKYLDKSPVFDKDVREGIANYSNFLLGSKAHGIKSKKELVAFLHEEDRHFRTFLANIDECSSMGMTEITNNTADICSNIYKAASEGILPTSETFNIPFVLLKWGQRIYTKEVRIARSFAKSNNLYGVKFVCYLYDKWVFRIMTEPGLVVDLAYPPTYIIVTEESEVRYSTPEEGCEVYQLTHIL